VPADPANPVRATDVRATDVRVTVVGKPGCHLCETACETVAAVCAELGVGWEELLITDHPELADRYWELVPVILVDGVQHDYFQVDPARLRSALR